MSLNIDLNGIKNGFVDTYKTVSSMVCEWTGRLIVVIKSGAQAAMPHLQDQRIAAISLIAVTLLLTELSNLFSHFWNKYGPDATPFQRGFRDTIDVLGGTAIITGGVMGFIRYTKLPFTPLAILGITAGTIIVRASLSKS